jgi:hypothetical protein
LFREILQTFSYFIWHYWYGKIPCLTLKNNQI